MTYKVIYHPDILKEDLPRIPKNIQDTIRRAIETRLLTDPFVAGEPLRRSLKGHRKLRVGDHRVIYRVQAGEIIILKIGHRKEVYSRVFSRLSS
jgi:mRNA interferase RelE/StbE